MRCHKRVGRSARVGWGWELGEGRKGGRGVEVTREGEGGVEVTTRHYCFKQLSAFWSRE